MNILIVEDDARISDFLERGLRAEGHRVKLARTGPDGLARAREVFLDDPGTVMLLDVMLPGMSGLEVCQTLRATQAELAAVANLSRQTVNQLLQQSQAEGRLRCSYGQLHLRVVS